MALSLKREATCLSEKESRLNKSMSSGQELDKEQSEILDYYHLGEIFSYLGENNRISPYSQHLATNLEHFNNSNSSYIIQIISRSQIPYARNNLKKNRPICCLGFTLKKEHFGQF